MQSSVCPAEIHYHAIKHILKYLYLTWHDCLHYWHPQPNESLLHADLPKIYSEAHDLLLDSHPVLESLDLHGYVDSDWATCSKTGRSFTGVCVCLAGGTIAYKSKIQPIMAQSSTETKLMGVSYFGWLILFIWSVLWDIGVPQEAASILYEDNNSCIAMAMSQKPTPRTGHMDIKYHALCKWVKRDLLKLERIDTTINLADHFTKQLRRVLFHRRVDYIFGKVPPMYSSAFAQFSKHTHLTKNVPPKMLPETDLVWLPIVAAAARLEPHGHIYSAIPFDSVDHTLPKTYYSCWALVTIFRSLMFSLGHTHPLLTCVHKTHQFFKSCGGGVRYRYIANTYLVS
jgi:hypothetical protein